MSLNREKEERILHECLALEKMDGLVKEYTNLIRATVRKTFALSGITPAPQDIEDVCMDVYVRLFSNNCKKLRQFDPEKLSLAGWIKLIANQTTIDEMRKKDPHSVSRLNERIVVDDIYHMLKCGNEDNYEARERLRMVVDTIEEMLPNDRKVLKMFYFDQLSLKEVAQRLGKSNKTTQTVKDRARRRLAEKMDQRMQV